MHRALVRSLPFLFVFLMVDSLGWAQQSDEEIAITEYERAAQFFETGQFQECIDSLETAYAYYPAPIFIYNIARAYAELKEFDKALEHYELYLTLNDDDPETIASAEEAVKHLRPIVEAQSKSLLTIEVNEGGSSVLLNEELVGTTPLEPLELPNGGYTITIQKEGFIPYTAEIAVNGNTNLMITLEPKQVPVAEPVVVPPEPEVPIVKKEEAETPLMIYFGYGALGVGVIATVVAVILDVGNQSTIDDYEAAAKQGDAERFKDLKNDVESTQTMTLVMYSLAGVGLVTGAVLLTLGYLDDEPSDEVGVGLQVGEGVGVVFTGRF